MKYVKTQIKKKEIPPRKTSLERYQEANLWIRDCADVLDCYRDRMKDGSSVSIKIEGFEHRIVELRARLRHLADEVSFRTMKCSSSAMGLVKRSLQQVKMINGEAYYTMERYIFRNIPKGRFK